MQFTVNEVFNASQEMMESYKYPNVRLFTADLVESHEPYYDLKSVLEPWSIPSPETVAKGPKVYFSALCWFYGRNIYDHFKYPIGLVVSCWGGTPIEAWSSPDSLRKCNITDEPVKDRKLIYPMKNPAVPPNYGGEVPGPAEHSILWNSMIHPFLNLTVRGVLWYQGESNAPAPESYSCSFPAMIEDWRDKFYIGTDKQTDQQFPFGFVQISSVQGNETLINGYPTIRWHQTADYGYVPNKKMPNVFMAVAMDIGDPQSPWGPVHPRYKEDAAHRLTLAGRAVAYGENYVKFQGPFPTEIIIIPQSNIIDIIYDNKKTEIVIHYDNGFEVCCSPTNNCTYISTDWHAAPISSAIGTYGVQLSTKQCSNETMQAIRYAWRDYPCVYKQCSVYSRVNALPAPIFLFSLTDKRVIWK
ncbi:LOW QUALITY PROTEIN: sialate O-acetylesterase-like [Ptychodera flava]|uniref:LOW QUALITY PROTEIN: sialate O-acetylesterase-like n=1 Tax=Ptychodera flava TaxID=63121 RepID=UPI00396A5C56